MTKVARKYDFTDGTKVHDYHLDDEFNNLVDGVNSLDDELLKIQSTTDGDSGADFVKATPLTPESGDTVQSNLEYTLGQIQGVSQGGIADGSVTETKLAAAVVAKLNPTDQQLLAKILNVDGAGSGLDADLLDGKDSARFVVSSKLLYRPPNSTQSGLAYGNGRVYKYNPTVETTDYTYTVLDSSTGAVLYNGALPTTYKPPANGATTYGAGVASGLMQVGQYVYQVVCNAAYTVQVMRAPKDGGAWTGLASSGAITGSVNNDTYACIDVRGIIFDGNDNIYVMTNTRVNGNNTSPNYHYAMLHKYTISTNTWQTNVKQLSGAAQFNIKGVIDPSGYLLYNYSDPSNTVYPASYNLSTGAIASGDPNVTSNIWPHDGIIRFPSSFVKTSSSGYPVGDLAIAGDWAYNVIYSGTTSAMTVASILCTKISTGEQFEISINGIPAISPMAFGDGKVFYRRYQAASIYDENAGHKFDNPIMSQDIPHF